MGTLPKEITLERHRARAARLRDLMDDSYKLNEECLGHRDPPVVVEPTDGGPEVPYRYVGRQYDGSSTWLVFDNELEPLRQVLEAEIVDEAPWAPDDVIDLDTGHRWGSYVKVTLLPYTHRLSWTYQYSGGRLKSSRDFHDRESAEKLQKTLSESNNSDYRDFQITELTGAS